MMKKNINYYLAMSMLLFLWIGHMDVAFSHVDDAIQIVFTDPFEDADDGFAILSRVDEALKAKQQLILVTANEIVDEQGLGLRAMALYQWLVDLSRHQPLLKKALNQGQIEVVQGQISQRFSQDYQKFITQGTGDTHFYNPTLVAEFYQNLKHPTWFKDVDALRQDILRTTSPLVITSIASANDVAHFIIGYQYWFVDEFQGKGSPSEQIEQAKQYYQEMVDIALIAYTALPEAQNIVKRTRQLWQMSGGIDGMEEYNEKQSRIASDFLNQLFSAKTHGLTPINTSELLHPMLEPLHDTEAEVWPVDEQIQSTTYLISMFRENLLGQGRDGRHQQPYPGYFDKRWHHQPIKSLNHDTLAVYEAQEKKHRILHCHVEYSFDKRVKRSYQCSPTPQETEDITFTIAVSDATFQLIQHRKSKLEIAEKINQQTDMLLMDTLFHLFSAPFNRLGIFDFDGTITVDESFKHPVDNPKIVRENTKSHIKSILRKDGAIFAVNSFIDAPTNVLIYLKSIFGETPQLIEEKPYYLFNKKRQKQVLAFYLGAYKMKSLPMPVYITNLPKLNPTPDPETGEKNIAYHMAIEALEDTGKNIPSTEIAKHLYEAGYLSAQTKSAFFDDNLRNAEMSNGFILLNNAIKSYLVTPHIKAFEAKAMT